MKKVALIFAVICLAIFTMSYSILMTNGIAGQTGSPGETNCHVCHNSNPINTAGGSISTNAPNLYICNTTYHISVTVSRANCVEFGFGLEALQTSGENAGTLVITNPTETQIKTATIGGNVRNNVVHYSFGGATLNSHTFTFDWIAPSSVVGAVTFYIAGNAGDGISGPSIGDYIYTSSKVILPSLIGINDFSFNNYAIEIYPNPTTESCVLNYNLASNSKVAVELISLNGQLVRSYLNQEEKAGNQSHTLAFDQSIAKGVYFISLNINGTKHIQKIVVE